MSEVTLVLAFLAGVVSFLSPCVLPLIPAYLTFLAGTTLKKSDIEKNRAKIFISSVFFVLGFSIIFSVLGVLLQSLLSEYAYDLQVYLGYVGGAIIILFGLQMLGIISIPFLDQERKLHLKKVETSYVTSFLFGAAFAVGWTPCVGPVLGAILTVAVTTPDAAFGLLLAYTLGLGMPFLLTGLFISQSLSFIKWIAPYLRVLNIVFGILLVILGILVFTGTLPIIASFAPVNDFLLG